MGLTSVTQSRSLIEWRSFFMNNQATDTVNVRLTAAGQKAAGDGPLTVHGGRVSLTFKGSEAQAVNFAVWNETLRRTAPYGQPYFELVPDAPAAKAATKT